ncbi:phosphopantetheine-binding protein [Enterobacter sp. 22466]|uniref:phosphopantetheine-binding protein n=1 Tax=Enterobacter sp. 22466 TaxID=3453924 RepID=UPI003F876344
MNYLHEIYLLVNQVNGYPLELMQPQDRLQHELGMDSIEIVDLILRLEDKEVYVQENQLHPELTLEEVASWLSCVKSRM